MNLLLTSDLHLTDVEIESYRWKIFDFLKEEAIKNKVSTIFMLGDCWDRKDRHSGKLLNLVVDTLQELRDQTNCDIVISAGNHDAPLTGVYYWNFLNKLGRIFYITEPTFFRIHKVWLFPFSSNPTRDWKDIDFTDTEAIFMHQPVDGAVVDGKFTLKNITPLPKLPDVPIFSGDIHHPQTLDNIIYIGVPHPVKFNESWENRIILIENNDFINYKEIWLNTTKRAILEIKSTDELKGSIYRSGDQLRIKYSLSGKDITKWPSEEQKIRKWASDGGIYLASVEASFTSDTNLARTDSQVQEIQIMQPSEVIKKFGAEEKLSEDVISVGLELLKESI